MLLSGASASEPLTDHDLRRRIWSRRARARGAHDGRQVQVAERQAKVVGGPDVLARLEVGERQVEAHPRQVGIAGQHGAEADDGGLPIAPLQGDGTAQKIHIVDVAFPRPEAVEQEGGVIRLPLRQRRAGGFDQRLCGKFSGRFFLGADRTGKKNDTQSQLQCQ